MVPNLVTLSHDHALRPGGARVRGYARGGRPTEATVVGAVVIIGALFKILHLEIGPITGGLVLGLG